MRFVSRYWQKGQLAEAGKIRISMKLQLLEEEIGKLSPEELARLRDWFLERDAQQWDRKIEKDAVSGKLDKLFKKSLADHEAGKSREI